jgi:hypothetical protein
MPFKSDRQETLSELDQLLIYAWMDDNDELTSQVAEISALDSSSRYLHRGQKRRRESYYFSEVFPDLPDGEFRAMFRTTKECFKGVLALIKDNPVFHNASRCQQTDPANQLPVTLARFGSYGNGGSISKIQSIFQIGSGTATLFTKRVVNCLLDLHDDWIKWPDESRQSEIGQVMREEGFPGCVGFIDGTTINISQKPARDGESYFDRKKRLVIVITGFLSIII